MKYTYLKTGILLLGTALLSAGCGSKEDSGPQSKLEAADALLFPNNGTQGAIDASAISEGEYSLKSMAAYSDQKSDKIKYSLELPQAGDLSQEKTKFSLKTAWSEDDKNTISVHSLQLPTPLLLRSSGGETTFDREATITFQASSDGKAEWSPGEQVRTDTATLLGSLFSPGAIRDGLSYKLLGKQGIVVQRTEGISIFMKSEDQDSQLVVEFIYVKTGSIKANRATPPASASVAPSTAGPSFSEQPILKNTIYAGKYGF